MLLNREIFEFRKCHDSSTGVLYVPLGVSLSGGGASETESDEDASAATVGATVQLPGRRNNTHQEHLGLHRLAFLEQ